MGGKVGTLDSTVLLVQEMERLFCPTCGNAALQKVEVVIGENGAEQYGVRKRHIIRGTKYSLPKPRVRFLHQDPSFFSSILYWGIRFLK